VLVGDIEVLPVLDAFGPLGELDELYPDRSPDDWEPYRELYPDLFAGTRWRLPCTCYVLRTGGATLLIDTGLGPPGLVGWQLDYEGGLPEGLREHGVSRDDVDVVFLTHLHIDHLGWNTDERGEIFFPRARYVVHRDALAFARDRRELPHIKRCVEPLADRFETVEGAVELAPGVTAVPLPGHYPGHMGVRLESAGTRRFSSWTRASIRRCSIAPNGATSPISTTTAVSRRAARCWTSSWTPTCWWCAATIQARESAGFGNAVTGWSGSTCERAKHDEPEA
jgi:hypothetical protein